MGNLPIALPPYGLLGRSPGLALGRDLAEICGGGGEAVAGGDGVRGHPA